MASSVQPQPMDVKGSAQVITKFFDMGINNICFLRKLAPEDSFNYEDFHGLRVWRSSDKCLSHYITSSLVDVQDWLEHFHLLTLKMVVRRDTDNEVVEIWWFNIDNAPQGHQSSKITIILKVAMVIDGEMKEIEKLSFEYATQGHQEKLEKEVLQETMKSLTKQIMTFDNALPVRSYSCSMRLEATITPDAPMKWIPCEAAVVKGGESQNFRTFATDYHKLSAGVDYKD